MKFWKMSGAGNDFVLITGSPRRAAALRALARRLCDRRLSVGADGLLHVRRAGPGLMSLRYFNSDGSEAFCGNGSRCAAMWAFMNGLVPRRFRLATIRGELPVEITGKERARMSMPAVRKVSLRHPGRWPAGVKEVHFLDTGVPHAVVPVKDLGRLDVRGLGSALRRHRAFGRAGANVDFVENRNGRVLVRTYERGVEDETPACGTGLTAAAVALALSGAAASPVRLRSRGGDDFTVRLTPSDQGGIRRSRCRAHCDRPGRGAGDISIEGPARLVFEGEIG
ncbi:MAG: diaminopimelate epimerase [Elusimicrobia bacterium]|nr:MAG: diaminopimelate epimerase [Elusimicrobiota bacterium]KAF0157349.1 MAG: diaminopimelate epimerase [Elusimicrobiota bacterium]